ncbi:MAG: hypothetical protein ACLTSL_00495 [Odoribacter splanchnicus]
MDKILDKSFDDEFDKIRNLVWYPWVGKGYKNSPCKVLIIGESQYAVTEDKKYDEDTANAFNKNKETAREFVYNTVTREILPAKFYTNLLNTFISAEQTSAFWNKISFYHFFQTTDKAVSGNNHLKEECLNAWNLWREVIEVLQPDVCIFCGIGLRKFYETWNKKADWKDVEAAFVKENQQLPIQGKFSISPDKIVDLLFIHHPSAPGYSPGRWNEFLKQQLPEMMQWLNK